MNVRVAIHVHVFYDELWPELEGCIRNVVEVCGADKVKLVITCSGMHATLEQLLKEGAVTFGCDCEVVPVPNRGYDVGPFVCEFLPRVNLSETDYIVKIHTKRDVDTWMNFRPMKRARWRRELLKFCATKEAFRRTLEALGHYPKLGFVTSHRVINYCGSDWGEDARVVKQMLRDEFGLAPRHLVTASGTMFCARAEIFKPFQERYTFDDFPLVCEKSAHLDYGLAAQLEYAFTMAADAMGYIVSEGRWSPLLACAGYAVQSLLFSALRLASKIVRFVASR